MGANTVTAPEVRPGKNTSGTDMVKGVIVKLKATPIVPGEVDLETSNTGAIYGVTNEAIANGKWGGIAIRGRVEVLGGGTIATGVRVMPTAAGASLTCTAGNSVLGIAVTDGALAAYHVVELTGPGGARMPG
jgi:hypothetical protein